MTTGGCAVCGAFPAGASGGAQKPMRIASMVAFPVKFRLYLHVLVDVLAVVDALAVDLLVDV